MVYLYIWIRIIALKQKGMLDDAPLGAVLEEVYAFMWKTVGNAASKRERHSLMQVMEEIVLTRHFLLRVWERKNASFKSALGEAFFHMH